MTKQDILELVEKAAKNKTIKLDLSGNELTSLPPEIVKLTNLTTLNLSENKLTTLPPEIVELTNLTALNLSWNALTTLPPEIVELTNLTTLDLFGNKLTTLPPEIIELTNLTTLDLSRNKLTTLPPKIVKLTNLTTLDLSRNQLTTLPPEIVKLTNLTTLNLSENQLTTLPPEIVKLTNLTTLDLSENQLTTLPPEIVELTNLTTLDLSTNRLASIPPEIIKLTNLTTLDLSRNQLTSLPPEIIKLTKLTTLELSRNQLTSLPPEIIKLTNLTTLNLYKNQLASIPPEIIKLTNLTTLDLSRNQLTSIPSEIIKLTNLTTLGLSENQLASIPPEIVKLTNLITLYLSSNQLTSLPPEIVKLTNLTTLDLSSNQLTSFLPEIGELTNLTTLNLYNNQLTSLPPGIGKLTNLTTLNLYNNQLTSLPPEIIKLTNLSTFNLYNNQLTSLPLGIGELTNLTTLNLYNNQLTSLPPRIGGLTNLITLYLSSNQLTSLPPEIIKLTNLTMLGLSSNQLTSLPPIIGELINLNTLYLSSNQLTSLPPEIIKLTNLSELGLSENPLTSPPPEIVKQGLKAIFEYLRKLSEEKIEHNEAKLILVGQGDVGKTCLAKRLIYDAFKKEETTMGIDILEWNITAPTKKKENIKLNVWDFGGQEIYHATHQFFLTKRSLYLLVWNARKSRDYENIFYWLHTIEAFGEDSPIILVMSKLNERDDDLNMKDIKEKFPQIVGLYKVDNEDGIGIPALMENIRQTAWHLPHMRTPWVGSWFKVREKLEHDGREWIAYDEFFQICTKEGLDKTQVDILDEYLHDLGVIIHFKDILDLRNMVILKPEWATRAFYQILDTKSVRDRSGILLHGELDKIWDIRIYPQDIYPKLLELMNKFELAYVLPDKKSHLVAELLPSTEPEFEWDDTNALCFYYCYDFLPAGVMTRFIVRMHQDLEYCKNDGKQLCWREGALVNWEKTHAFVKVKPMERLIEIKINGNKKRELLAIIRREFNHINSSIKKVKITEEIPCNCSRDCPTRFEYSKLIRAENAGFLEVDCLEKANRVPISLLLDGYEKKENRMKEINDISRERGLIVNLNQVQNVSQNVSQENIQKQENTQLIKIELPAIQSYFEDLKDLLIKADPNLERNLNEIGDSLDEVNADADKEKLIKPFNKVGRFLKKLGDENSDIHKIIKGTEKGIEYAQKLGKTYNKFAQLLALPQVPDLVL